MNLPNCWAAPTYPRPYWPDAAAAPHGSGGGQLPSISHRPLERNRRASACGCSGAVRLVTWDILTSREEGRRLAHSVQFTKDRFRNNPALVYQNLDWEMAVGVTIPRSANAVASATHRNAFNICKLRTDRKEIRQHCPSRIFCDAIMRVVCSSKFPCSCCGATRTPHSDSIKATWRSHRVVVSFACEERSFRGTVVPTDTGAWQKRIVLRHRSTSCAR
jgi:hypothetical protein